MWQPPECCLEKLGNNFPALQLGSEGAKKRNKTASNVSQRVEGKKSWKKMSIITLFIYMADDTRSDERLVHKSWRRETRRGKFTRHNSSSSGNWKFDSVDDGASEDLLNRRPSLNELKSGSGLRAISTGSVPVRSVRRTWSEFHMRLPRDHHYSRIGWLKIWKNNISITDFKRNLRVALNCDFCRMVSTYFFVGEVLISCIRKYIWSQRSTNWVSTFCQWTNTCQTVNSVKSILTWS